MMRCGSWGCRRISPVCKAILRAFVSRPARIAPSLCLSLAIKRLVCILLPSLRSWCWIPDVSKWDRTVLPDMATRNLHIFGCPDEYGPRGHTSSVGRSEWSFRWATECKTHSHPHVDCLMDQNSRRFAHIRSAPGMESREDRNEEPACSPPAESLHGRGTGRSGVGNVPAGATTSTPPMIAPRRARNGAIWANAI